MDFNKIVEEIYDGGGGNYGAYSQPARKDFAPMSMKNGYDYPYQNGGTTGELSEPPPDGPVSWPWPLQTLPSDIGDSFVYLMTGMSKMSQCIKQNPSLHKDAKTELIELFKKRTNSLDYLIERTKYIEKKKLKNFGRANARLNIAPNPPLIGPLLTVATPR